MAKAVVLKLKIAFEIARKMHQKVPMRMTRRESEGVRGSSVVGTSPSVLLVSFGICLLFRCTFELDHKRLTFFHLQFPDHFG